MSALVGLLVLAGCGDRVSGVAITAPPPAPWDPCSLTDDILSGAMLNPMTENSTPIIDRHGEKSCGWTGLDVGVIMSTLPTARMAQLRGGDNIDFREVTVAGRSGVTYRDEGDRRGVFCHLAVPFASGGIMLMQVARSPFGQDQTTPMCVWAVRVAEVLVAGMPR
ncbi:DUF3558 domain-containing protein [Skermania piniformis]|uniref:DUF3558 domain-containing protein n=1 Tax=Skermania pinensis TaxID=39122 RepID=A0ABX8SGB6_9ACTN|nr:DUF3558 domain-containing protein [Skermania piniformis]